jgi:lactoylglutathione lyase
MIIQIIGFIAASLTTLSFVPQAIKTWRSRSTDDLSPFMFALFCIGVLSWLIYGIFKQDPPIIIANFVTFILAGIIMYFIIVKTKVRRIAHIGIYVYDLEKMKEFYVDKFSATTSSKYNNPQKNFSSYFLTFSSGAKLELMHNPGIMGSVKDKWQMHVAISVGKKHIVDTLTEKLQKDGVEILSSPRRTNDGYYESVVIDPEGNLIEITE